MAGNKQSIKGLLQEMFGSGAVQPLSGGRGKKEIRARARLAYGPQKRELEAQKRASREHQKRIKSYFQDYNQAVKGAGARTADAYQGAINTQLAAAERLGVAPDTSAREASASLYGGSADPSVGQTFQAASQAQSQGAVEDVGLLAGLAANQDAYMQDRQRIGVGARNDALMQEIARRRSIGDEMQDLAREKGAFMAATRGDLRNNERAYLIDLLSQHRGLKQMGMDERFRRDQFEYGQQRDNKDRRAAKAAEAGAGAKEKGTEKAAAQKELKAEVREALGLLAEDPPPAGTSFGEIVETLHRQGYSRVAARRAARRYGVDPQDIIGDAIGDAGGAIGGR